MQCFGVERVTYALVEWLLLKVPLRLAIRCILLAAFAGIAAGASSCKKKDEPVPARTPSPMDAYSNNRPALPNTGNNRATTPSDAPPPGAEPEKVHVAEAQKQLEFVVNKALLGSVVNLKRYGIVFAPPKDWKPVPANTYQQLVRLPEDSDVKPTLLYSFRNDQTQSGLAVSHLQFPRKGMSFRECTDAYLPQVKKSFDPNPVEVSGFNAGSIRFVQYLIQQENQAIFRMLCMNPDKEVLQFDYILPRQGFKKEIQAAEPSIGSIAFFKSPRP
jgi:hypothetical protein